jgi:riboflavin synthase
MFTGIVKETGKVVKRSGPEITVETRIKGRLGESVAINGACLTVVGRKAGTLRFDVSDETYRLTNLGSLAAGDPVNLEPALKAGDALGGHMVSGHVDARALVLEREVLPEGFARLRVELPKALKGLAALKGSIAIDGVSLTVTAVGRGWFETVLVPHTLAVTTLGALKKGSAVNLEADMIARYVRSILSTASTR